MKFKKTILPELIETPSKRYTVVCDNIGTVYAGTSRVQAFMLFNFYLDQSTAPFGRASGESVVWFEGDDIVREHIGRNHVNDDSDLG